MPNGAGAGGGSDVVDVDAGAFLDPGAGVEQHGDDRGVACATTGRGPLNSALLLAGQRVGLARAGYRARLTEYAVRHRVRT
jgi:hypothetical protein